MENTIMVNVLDKWKEQGMDIGLLVVHRDFMSQCQDQAY